MIDKIFKLIYQIMLIAVIAYVGVCKPDYISILIVLCTWYIASVIRDIGEKE